MNAKYTLEIQILTDTETYFTERINKLMDEKVNLFDDKLINLMIRRNKAMEIIYGPGSLTEQNHNNSLLTR